MIQGQLINYCTRAECQHTVRQFLAENKVFHNEEWLRSHGNSGDWNSSFCVGKISWWHNVRFLRIVKTVMENDLMIFSVQPGLLNTKMSLHHGYMQQLSTIYRTGDIIWQWTEEKGSLYANIGFQTLDVSKLKRLSNKPWSSSIRNKNIFFFFILLF